MSHSRTPLQNPVVRRFSQVYVEIPPSPLHGSRMVSGTSNTQHVSTLSANRKENAPLRPSDMFQTQSKITSTSPIRKRKLSESDTNMAVAAVPSSSMKKAKHATDAKVAENPKGGTLIQGAQSSNVSEEFPNGFFYCHQCSKKRDSANGIHCTWKDAQPNRCRVKFCTPCLKNRYGERVDEIKNTAKTQDDLAHVRHETYIWKCPKCRDTCNCARCRKAKGLEPTGNLTTAARRADAGSVAVMLSENPATIGILPGKGQQTAPAEKKPRGRKPKEPAQASTSTSSANSNKQITKVKPGAAAGASTKPKPKPKTPPTLKWSKILIDGRLPLSETESRIQIREFVLRFACIMDSKSLSRKMLEELEGIGGDGSNGKGRGWDSDNDDEEEDVVGWVSEPCAKGIVMGLLGLIHSDEDGSKRKLIGDAIKELRGSGANLTKVWAILASLRESIGQSSDILDAADSLSNIPDPLPASSSATYRHTRNTRTANANAVLVAQSSQMVPVLVKLTEAALETEVLRSEIEEGVKEGKDKGREARECIKNENERWEKQKEKEKEKDPKAKEAKLKRETHKRTVLDLEESLKVAMNAYVPRFGGLLGKDMDGRLYWALSPGVTERENAIQTIAQSLGEESKGKKYKRTVPDDGERKGMKKWSWFIAVWGKGPVPDGETENINKKAIESDEESESDDPDQNCWWGFWEPAEIKKVADWIEIRGGLGGDIENSKDAVKTKTDADGQDADVPSRGSSPLSAMSDTDDTDVNLYAENSSKAELKGLVKGLKEYANLLEWRIRQDDDDTSAKSNGSGSGVVAANKFYN